MPRFNLSVYFNERIYELQDVIPRQTKLADWVKKKFGKGKTKRKTTGSVITWNLTNIKIVEDWYVEPETGDASVSLTLQAR